MQRASSVVMGSAGLLRVANITPRAMTVGYISCRNGGHVVEKPVLPLRNVARFTLQEVERLFRKFEEASNGKDSLSITKDSLSPYLEPLGVETTPKNVSYWCFGGYVIVF